MLSQNACDEKNSVEVLQTIESVKCQQERIRERLHHEQQALQQDLTTGQTHS